MQSVDGISDMRHDELMHCKVYIDTSNRFLIEFILQVNDMIDLFGRKLYVFRMFGTESSDWFTIPSTIRLTTFDMNLCLSIDVYSKYVSITFYVRLISLNKKKPFIAVAARNRLLLCVNKQKLYELFWQNLRWMNFFHWPFTETHKCRNLRYVFFSRRLFICRKFDFSKI